MKPKAPGAKCEECPLKGCDFVPSEANKGAAFVVVGNHPTEPEVQQKRPFMGPAGNMLTSAFSTCGVQRGDIHWTSTVLCRPPENNMETFLNGLKKRNKTIERENRRRTKEGLEKVQTIPTPHECCAPRLQQELKRFKKIVPCGSTAIKHTVHRSASIRDLRGGPMEVDRDGETLQILPIMHPSYVHKSLRWFATFKNDVGRAVKWFRTGSLNWKPPHVLYHPTAEQLRTFLNAPNVPYWTYDVETDGIECLTANLRCIAVGTVNAVVVVGYLSIDGKTPFYTPQDMAAINAVFKEFFEDETKLKAGHNAGYYDKIVMKERLGIDVTPLLDSMIIHRLVESELPHNLGFVGSLYTEAPSWKTDRDGRKKAYGSETDKELHEYCAYDVAVTAAVIPPLLKRTKERNQNPLVSCDHDLQRICSEMHTAGMYVDQRKRAKYERTLLKQITKRRDEIRSLAELENFNPASTLQLRELIYDTWELDPPVEDKFRYSKLSGELSTSDHVLRSLLSLRTLTPFQREVITQVRQYRKCQKLLGTYVTKLRFATQEAWGGWDDEEDAFLEKEWRDRYGTKKLGIVDPKTGRMYPGYNAHVTTSGRLSSSKPINAQNFPSSLRDMVIPAPGNIFVGADMDQLELRIAASRWKSKKYLKAFRDGLDPHSSVTAYAVFGERFEKAAIACGVGPYPWATGTKFTGDAKKLRNLSKSVQYASQYWATVQTVHRVITQTEIPDPDDPNRTLLPYVNLSVKEVRLMHQKWCKGAKFERGWEREIETWRAFGYLEEPVHKRRRDFLDGENPNEIVNFPIQAAGASLMNNALIELSKRIPLYKWGKGTGIINQCHDSIMVECPISEAEWVKDQINECMNMTHPAFPGVVFTAEAEIGINWKEV